MKHQHFTLAIITITILALALACSPLAQPQQQIQSTPTAPTWSEEADEAVMNSNLTELEKNIQSTSPVVVATVEKKDEPKIVVMPTSPVVKEGGMLTNGGLPYTLPTTTTPNFPPTPTPSPLPPLEITLDKTKLEPTVKEIVYLAVDKIDSYRTISHFWRADVTNISQATHIISFTHRTDQPIKGAILSPNNQYVAFGQEYNRRTGLMDVSLLNINDGTLERIDRDIIMAYYAQTLLWSTDSQSLIYVKPIEEWLSSELYQYSMDTRESTILFKEEFTISLVGWNDLEIYYLLWNHRDDIYIFKSYNMATDKIETIYEHKWKIPSVKQSPDRQLIWFNNEVVDLKAKTKIAETPLKSQLWLPDSKGLIMRDEQLKIVTDIDFEDQTSDKLILQIKLPSEKIGLVDWSPDGQYLIYRNQETSLYYLFNITTTEIQTFTSVTKLIITGWVN